METFTVRVLIQQTILILSAVFLFLGSESLAENQPRETSAPKAEIATCIDAAIPFPLHHYSRQGNYQQVECLLKGGYPVDTKDEQGLTALQVAIYFFDGKDKITIQSLLNYQPLVTSESLNTLLSGLLEYIEANAKPDELVVRRYIELTRNLVRHGADLSDDSGILGLSIFANFVLSACEADLSARFPISSYFEEILMEQKFTMSEADFKAISKIESLGRQGILYDSSCLEEAKAQISI